MYGKSSISIKSWRNNFSGLLIALFLFSGAACRIFAQINQSDRYEIVLDDHGPEFHVSNDEKGLFLSRHGVRQSKDFLELIRLDTSFRELWRGSIMLDNHYLLAGRRMHDNAAFFLFRHLDPTVRNLVLYKVEEDGGEYTQYTIKSYIRFLITDLQLIDNAILIGGYFNRVPLVLYFNMINHQSKILPGMFNEAGELSQIKPYGDGTFDVLISAENFTKQRTIWVKSYDPDGNLIAHYTIAPEENKNLIFGRAVKTDRNTQLIAGVYGRKNSEFSRGLFVASVNSSGYQRLRYYNFGDLENFFKYMKAKRESRVKQRIERRKIRGKRLQFNYRFLVHEVIEHDGQFILLGEAFYPKYKTIESPYYSVFRPMANFGPIRNGQIFDGYWYTHAVIMAFDENGDLLWDNSFEINDIKTFTLEQFVKIEVKDDRIILLYLFENTLRTKIIQGNRVLEGKNADPVRTLYSNDIPLSFKSNTPSGKLEYWYDNYFYAYGVQQIINYTDTPSNPKRRVFFINKISCQ